MAPSIISDVQHTDHGPCANLYVYKPTQIYETVPRLSTYDILLHCFALLPHCSTPYSSAFAQHCIVAYPPVLVSCTRLYPHRLYPPRVSPSDPVSLLQVRPLPTISSESQHVQIHMYISRPKYIRLSPDCPLVIFSYIALSFAHCFILYSSAFAQHCIITHCCLFTDSTCLYYYHQPHPQVLPLNYTSLSTMQSLPAISSELQHILLLPLM